MKQSMLDTAEVIDAWRIFPRIYMAVYLFFLWDIHQWYEAVARYPDVYVNLVWGTFGVVTGFYLQSGRKWV